MKPSCLIRNAMIYRTDRRVFTKGDLLVLDGRIAAVSEGTSLAAEPSVPVVEADGGRLIPGLVDVHTHGRAGGDFGTADSDALERMAESYLASGVTTLLPTLASATPEELAAAVSRLNGLYDKAAAHTAGRLPHVAGIHLEGRYLNLKKRGAHAPELLAPPDPEELEPILTSVKGARHISAALELDTDGEFLRRALALGATLSIGHSEADYATAKTLMEQGVTALTHTFNAMLPLHHRDGGAVAAGLLTEGVYCEMICDGFHIAPHMVALAYRLAGERLTLITDSMEATGCPDGEYSIAGMPVTVKDGKARTHDGAIAGSTLSLWQAVENLRDFAEISLENAIYAATMAPALEVGLADEVGSLSEGKRADLLLLGEDSRPERVMCGGYWYPND